MKKTIQIQDGLVVVCGPTASGKTTLAKRIIEESPYRNKILLSVDAEARKFLHEAGLPEEMMRTGLDKATNALFHDWLVERMASAFSSDSFIVYEGVCNRDNKMWWSLRLFPLDGFCRPITLIKVFPDLELHTKFMKSRRRSKFPVSPQELLLQRAMFQSLAEEPLFADCDWIREYLITDPTQIRLDFMKSRQCSKELLAAFMLYENSKKVKSS